MSRSCTPNPEAYAQSFGKGEWDIAIGPRVLAAAEKSDLSVDIWLIDLIYVAAPGQSLRTPAKLISPESRWELSRAVHRTDT
jgi:hypothetical protein